MASRFPTTSPSGERGASAPTKRKRPPFLPRTCTNPPAPFFFCRCGKFCGKCTDDDEEGLGFDYSTTGFVPTPGVFKEFVAYKNKNFGVWGEFLVDVHFHDFKLLDHGIAGIEFAYINGRGTKHVESKWTDILLVGRSNPEEKVYLPVFSGGESTEPNRAMCEIDPHLSAVGTVTGCVHGMHMSGIGSEITYVRERASECERRELSVRSVRGDSHTL